MEQPFKIVEEINTVNLKVCRKWIILTKHIDYEKGVYISIQPFHEDFIKHDIEHVKMVGTTFYFNKGWLRRLFKDIGEELPIETLDRQKTTLPYIIKQTFDNIRNPTLEEMNVIQLIFKLNNCKFNRKTNQLIDNDNE